MNKKEVLQLTSKIFDYVLELEDKDLNDFLKGKKELVLVEKERKEESLREEKGKIVKKSKSTPVNKVEELSEVEKMIKELDNLETREEVMKLLSNKNITVKFLKELAREKKVHILSRAKKSDIINKIIEGTVGAKLRIKSLGDA